MVSERFKQRYRSVKNDLPQQASTDVYGQDQSIRLLTATRQKPCVVILLNGNLLREWSTVKCLGVTFESGLKLKVSLADKRMKFF